MHKITLNVEHGTISGSEFTGSGSTYTGYYEEGVGKNLPIPSMDMGWGFKNWNRNSTSGAVYEDYATATDKDDLSFTAVTYETPMVTFYVINSGYTPKANTFTPVTVSLGDSFTLPAVSDYFTDAGVWYIQSNWYSSGATVDTGSLENLGLLSGSSPLYECVLYPGIH